MQPVERGSITKALDISTSTFADSLCMDLSLSSFIVTDKGGISAREKEFNNVTQRLRETAWKQVSEKVRSSIDGRF